MTTKIHTHRGHCQLCASIQAINVNTGIIAEHGYTRVGGYFNGSCPGSKVMNLHVSRSEADSRIKTARMEARVRRSTALEYQNRMEHPEEVWSGAYRVVRDFLKEAHGDVFARGGARWCPLKQVEVEVLWDDATPEFQEKGRVRAIGWMLERAETCERYANTLEKWADRITGKVDPYLVSDLEPRDWEVGDTVRIGGKKGYDAVVEAVEIKPYSTFGWRRGRNEIDVKHVRVTKPAITEKRASEKVGGYVIREAHSAKTLWVAMRDIKDRKPNELVEELKKDGLL